MTPPRQYHSPTFNLCATVHPRTQASDFSTVYLLRTCPSHCSWGSPRHQNGKSPPADEHQVGRRCLRRRLVRRCAVAAARRAALRAGPEAVRPRPAAVYGGPGAGHARVVSPAGVDAVVEGDLTATCTAIISAKGCGAGAMSCGMRCGWRRRGGGELLLRQWDSDWDPREVAI